MGGTEECDFDVVIIGAGLAGLSTALSCLGAGLRVALVDQQCAGADAGLHVMRGFICCIVCLSMYAYLLCMHIFYVCIFFMYAFMHACVCYVCLYTSSIYRTYRSLLKRPIYISVYSFALLG